MNYYALDEALAYLESDDHDFSVLVEFALNDLISSTNAIFENVILEDGEEKKQNLWNKIIEAIKKAINFVKTKLARAFVLAINKINNLHLDSMLQKAKKNDKNNCLTKYTVSVLNYGTIARNIGKIINNEDAMKSNNDVDDLEMKKITIEKIPKYMYDSTRIIVDLSNNVDKITAKYNKLLKAASNHNDEELDNIRSNLVYSNEMVSACFKAVQSFMKTTGDIAYILDFIIHKPADTHEEMIKKRLKIDN